MKGYQEPRREHTVLRKIKEFQEEVGIEIDVCRMSTTRIPHGTTIFTPYWGGSVKNRGGQRSLLQPLIREELKAFGELCIRVAEEKKDED